MISSLIKLGASYAKPILIGLAVTGILLAFSFTYRLGYDSCDAEVKQAVNEALIDDKREAEDVRRIESKISVHGLDRALINLGIMRD